jgi:tricorn protease
MNGVDWNHVRDQYAPLLSRIASRGDLYDVVWELQNELRASHAFFDGGDYRAHVDLESQGFLGVDLMPEYEPAMGGYRIAGFARGDRWNAGAPYLGRGLGYSSRASSPLLAPGLDVRACDVIQAIDGQPVTADVSPRQLLVNKAKRDVELIIWSRARCKRCRVTVRALTAAEERGARYRDWVEGNRQRVFAATNGRVGYIHIPDMVMRPDGNGFGEFSRAYEAEYDRDGLIIDVRWNTGGNISPDILGWLTRTRVGCTRRQQGTPMPFPPLAPRGPMVALINEMTSSDGEIFSHLFRDLKLGPLVGTRTWGGTIGITRERFLLDHTSPTQPQLALCYFDVGCAIENEGVDPVLDPTQDRDKQVDIAPQDYWRRTDPQLERAIVEALRQIAAQTMRTPLPDVTTQEDDQRRAG